MEEKMLPNAQRNYRENFPTILELIYLHCCYANTQDVSEMQVTIPRNMINIKIQIIQKQLHDILIFLNFFLPKDCPRVLKEFSQRFLNETQYCHRKHNILTWSSLRKTAYFESILQVNEQVLSILSCFSSEYQRQQY